MAEPIKDTQPTDPNNRMPRLRTLLGANWSNEDYINRIEFQEDGNQGYWVYWTGDPLDS